VGASGATAGSFNVTAGVLSSIVANTLTIGSTSLVSGISLGASVVQPTYNMVFVNAGTFDAGSNGISAPSRNVTIQASDILIPGAITANIVTLLPVSAEQINFNGSSAVVGSFNVTSAVLSSITANNLTIGTTSLSGGILMGNNIDVSGTG